MQVKDIMTKNVISVSLETKITEVAEIIFKNKFHGVPVVEGGQVVGIITETDFFTKNSDNFFLPSYIKFLEENIPDEKLSSDQQEKLRKLLNSQARDIMTSDCVTILADMKIQDLLEFFKTTKFMTIPVVDEKNYLIGIVTFSDILGMMGILNK